MNERIKSSSAVNCAFIVHDISFKWNIGGGILGVEYWGGILGGGILGWNIGGGILGVKYWGGILGWNIGGGILGWNIRVEYWGWNIGVEY